MPKTIAPTGKRLDDQPQIWVDGIVVELVNDGVLVSYTFKGEAVVSYPLHRATKGEAVLIPFGRKMALPIRIVEA